MKKITMIFILSLLLVLRFNTIDAENDITVQLTPEEITFLEEHPVITLGVDPDFIPYEFIDIDNEYKGMAADYLKLIEEKTGIVFEIYDKELTWEEIYDKAINKEIDVLPCIGITEGRREIFLFSDSYIEYQRAIYSNTISIEKYDLGDLDEIIVGVQRNSSHHTYLTSELGVEPVLFSSVEEALIALSENQIDAFVGNLATTSYKLRRMNITNLELDTTIAGSINQLAFAVRDDWPLLVSIIDKGLAEISEEEILIINTKWIGIIDDGKDYTQLIRIALVIGGVLIVGVSLSMFWNYKLKREIQYRKEIEEQLKIANVIADNATKAKSEFLANMSHEIRTPMNAVIGLTRLLENTSLTDQQHDYVVKSHRASVNLLGIINDILDFSKIEAGKLVIEAIEFDLNEVIDNVASVMGLKAFESGIEFVVSKNFVQKHYLVGDPLRLGQIILNLTNNAVKFTPKGQVLLKFEEMQDNDENVTIKFLIQDTGIGMTEEQLEGLFKSFSQADSSTTRKYGGTGLGLTISKNLVERMGGEITVKSEYGVGSNFAFEINFPIGKPYKQKKYKFIENISNIKIMVVDNNEAARDVAKAYLDVFGMDVTLASSGLEAIECIDETFDLVLLDWEMPGANGDETWLAINEKLHGKVPKVILMTAYGRDEVLKGANKVGIMNILMKPISPSSLYNSIANVFGEEALVESYTLDADYIEGFDLIRGAKILVADDNEINQQVAKETLEDQGFIVDLAENGEVTVDLFEKNQDYDIILMDLQMPIMSGFEATKVIREKGYKDIPIVALTADVMAGIKDKVLAVGMNGIIAKPIDLRELFTELVKWIEPKERIIPSKISTKESERKDILEYLKRFNIKEGLNRLANNKKIYMNILQKYIANYSDFTQKLKKLIKDDDFETISREIHSFKGVTGNIGATITHRLVVELENLHRNKESVLELDKLNELEVSIEQDIKELEQMLLSHTSEEIETPILSNKDLMKQMNNMLERIKNYEVDCEKTFEVILPTLRVYSEEDSIALGETLGRYDYDEAYTVCMRVIEKLKAE